METMAAKKVDARANLVEENGETISRIGAHMVVLCKFVDAVLPQLTAAQCRQIDPTFRQGIEDAMARTDDVVVPGLYHTTLLEQTNVLLVALAKKSAMQH
jgi:hypothetical protein